MPPPAQTLAFGRKLSHRQGITSIRERPGEYKLHRGVLTGVILGARAPYLGVDENAPAETFETKLAQVRDAIGLEPFEVDQIV